MLIGAGHGTESIDFQTGCALRCDAPWCGMGRVGDVASPLMGDLQITEGCVRLRVTCASENPRIDNRRYTDSRAKDLDGRTIGEG